MKPYSEYKQSGVEWIGKLPLEWNRTKLKFDVIIKARVGWQNLRTEEFIDEGAYCITGTDFKDGKICWKNAYHVSEERYEVDTHIQVKEGDLLITKDGTIGKLALIDVLPDKACLNSGIFVVRPKSTKLSTKYLYWVLSSSLFSHFIDLHSTGSTIIHLYQNVFEKLDIPFPDIFTQNEVSRYLNKETIKIDNLISEKENFIKLLQEKRQTLISHVASKGLISNLPIKEVPFTKYLSEQSDYRGKTPNKTDSGVLLVTARNIKMGFIDYECSKEYIAEADYEEVMRRGLPNIGDLLFTTEAPLGNVALVDNDSIALAQRVIRFRTNENYLNSKYIVLLMQSDYFQNQIKKLAQGITAQGIKASKLNQLKVYLPTLEDQSKIIQHVKDKNSRIDSLVAETEKSIELLKEHRTALISAAVTGKIDVREVA